VSEVKGARPATKLVPWLLLKIFWFDSPLVKNAGALTPKHPDRAA